MNSNTRRELLQQTAMLTAQNVGRHTLGTQAPPTLLRH
jgi:hypothetical protein